MKRIIVALVCMVLLLCGCAESESMDNCWDCGAEYPEKYGIWGFDGNVICPYCAQDQINEQIRDQESMKSSIEDHGEYIPDIDYLEDYLVVEKSECNWCGNYAPSDLYDENGERICIDCITEALQNDKVARAIRNYLDYEY